MQTGNERRPAGRHAVSLDDRRKAIISGVEDVDSFNEQMVILATTEGKLTITGSNLNISKLNLEEGALVVEGEVSALEYSGRSKEARGVLGRLFK